MGIDARLDLHGFTIDEAYNKVVGFIDNCVERELRFLLIITGKGLHSKTATIKESLTVWFQQPYFANRIIKYTDAQAKHGGNGAVYVLLKR
jgi:DNA-nicking Smr family endonuclease